MLDNRIGLRDVIVASALASGRSATRRLGVRRETSPPSRRARPRTTWREARDGDDCDATSTPTPTNTPDEHAHEHPHQHRHQHPDQHPDEHCNRHAHEHGNPDLHGDSDQHANPDFHANPDQHADQHPDPDRHANPDQHPDPTDTPTPTNTPTNTPTPTDTPTPTPTEGPPPTATPFDAGRAATSSKKAQRRGRDLTPVRQGHVPLPGRAQGAAGRSEAQARVRATRRPASRSKASLSRR